MGGLQLNPSDAIRRDRDLLRKYVSRYIQFIDDATDEVLNDAHGSGMDGAGKDSDSCSDEEIPTTAPVAPFNDVRNDPYFVMR